MVPASLGAWKKGGVRRKTQSQRDEILHARPVTFPAFELDAAGLTSCIPIQQSAKGDVDLRI